MTKHYRSTGQQSERVTTIYRSYSFIDKDPVIDVFRTVIERDNISLKQLAEDSRVSRSTYTGWFSRGTKRPQFATLNATALAMGFELRGGSAPKLVRIKG